MTEGDRNARQMTGALLANAKLPFLDGVIEEAFGPSLRNVIRTDGVGAAKRRLEDAAFRGHLVRAVAGVIERHGRAGDLSSGELYEKLRPMSKCIFQDSANRMRVVLRLGRAEGIDDELAEQVDNYIVQVGELLRMQDRLARTVGEEDQFFDDSRSFFHNIAARSASDEGRFERAFRTSMQVFLFDLALQPRLNDPNVDLNAAGTTPEKALRQGITRLRSGLGDKAINWSSFEQQVQLR